MESTQAALKSTPLRGRKILPKQRSFLPFDPAKAGNTLSGRDLEKTMRAWSMGKAVRKRMENKLVSFLNEPLQHGVDRWITILNELSRADATGEAAQQKARISRSVESAILGYSQMLLSGAQVCRKMATKPKDWKILEDRHSGMMVQNGMLSSEDCNIALRENLQATSDLIRSRTPE
jgi:hypothetical protein